MDLTCQTNEFEINLDVTDHANADIEHVYVAKYPGCSMDKKKLDEKITVKLKYDASDCGIEKRVWPNLILSIFIYISGA